MEKFKIIGNASPEVKKAIQIELNNRLFDHTQNLEPKIKKRLEEVEILKTNTEITLINFANSTTNELMVRLGFSPYDIPVENYHILPPKEYVYFANGDAQATVIYSGQAILINSSAIQTPFHFALNVLHETMHLKGCFVMEVNENEGKINATPYREGVGVRSLQKNGFNGNYYNRFVGLHEAIVSEFEKRNLQQLLDLPELAKEKQWLESEEAKKIKQEKTQKHNIPEDEVTYVNSEDGGSCDSMCYRGPRKVLKFVCEEVSKNFSEQFIDSDDVYDIFLKAHFAGNLLEIGRLVEKIFGDSSFRLLGEMSADDESAEACLKKLIEIKKKY